MRDRVLLEVLDNGPILTSLVDVERTDVTFCSQHHVAGVGQITLLERAGFVQPALQAETCPPT